jgi:peptidoglycan/xylan/chitin deacetylase (PgdA/CDA1 family)
VSGTNCLVVMYHYVRDSAATPFPGIRALPPDLFRRQLDWLQAEYSLVSAANVEAALNGGAPLPPRAALLTFDDGFVDHYREALPALRDRGVSGIFFLSQATCGPAPRLLGVHKTHFLLSQLGAEAFGEAVLAECRSAHIDLDAAGVFGADRWEAADERAIKNLLNYHLPFEDAERVLDRLFADAIGDQDAFARGLYLDEGMVRDMAAAGMSFGYHTRTHRMLSRLSPSEQADELREGVGWIRALTRQATVSFCYPWGGPQTYSADTVRLLDACGYSMAFNTERRRADLQRDGRFELPRLDTRDLPPYTDGDMSAVVSSAGGGAAR